MDLSEKIADQVLRAVGNLDSTDPISHATRTAKERLRAVLGTDEALEVMVRAHDAEDAAQMGEPSPWRSDITEQAGHAHEQWREDRISAMRCALKSVGLA